jgi:hypothetical protein
MGKHQILGSKRLRGSNVKKKKGKKKTNLYLSFFKGTFWISILVWSVSSASTELFLQDHNPNLLILILVSCSNAWRKRRKHGKKPCISKKKKTFRYGRQYDLQQLPLMIKAGVKIMEAMRVVNMGMVKAAQRFVAVVEGGDYVWNMHRGDEVCV